MRIAVLGPLEVRADDLAPINVPGAKERLLLAVLAAGAPGVVSTDSLVETLWNGDAPVSARKSLQAHVVRLRSSLEPDRPRGSTGRYVVRRGTGYALTVDRSSIDRLAIGDLAARGHARLASGEPEEAERQLAAAVDLWRGEPYADWPDAAFAEVERRRLDEVRAGAVAGLLEARLQLGRHATVLPELERLVASDPLREDWWRLLLLALYRAGRQADAMAAARRVRALLADQLGASPGPALRAMEAAVLAQDPALEPAPRPRVRPVDPEAPDAARGCCPYKGLAAYQVGDAALFHGRGRLVVGLVAQLVDTPLLVVSGPSGAGKSSAVRAGLVPALGDGALPGSQTWRTLIVTPGRAPVDVLAPLTGDAPPADPVLLVCDQFEELWSPRIDPVERTAFLDTVVGLIDDGIVVRCVVVVRGDHVGRLAEHAAFTERLGATFALVPPVTDPELREIVREPARTVGLEVDTELLDAVATDVLGQAGALPLLSTALVGTWERRRGDRLTLAGYLEAGGVAGALTRSAEAGYAALDGTGQDLARRLFVRLADTDDGGALVRRPLPLGELDLAGDQGAARRGVVETFVGRRLLAVDGDRLEVAHEALLTAWPRMTRWLEEDAAGRAVRRHLAPSAREWDGGGRPDDELYRGARLTAALDWADGSDVEVTPLEREFLEASRSLADAELTAARERADAEAAGRHRTRRLAGGLAAVLVVALVTTLLAVRAQRDSSRSLLVADANRLAALSTTATSLDVALLLAAQAVRLADTPETQDALLAALTEHGRAERAVSFPGGDPQGGHLANGGRTLFMGNGPQVVTWSVGPSTQPEVAFDIPDWGSWRTAAASPVEDALMGAGDDSGVPWLRIISRDGSSRVLQEGDEVGGLPIGGIFSADGRRIHLLVARPDPEDPERRARWTLTDVDAQDGTSRATGIGGTYPTPSDELAVSFADDGSSAVLSSEDASAPATLIDLSDGRQSPTAVQDRPGRILGFRAVGTGAAQLWDDGGVTLLDSDGAVSQQLDVHQEPVRDVVISPDGAWGATVGDGPAAVLWDIDPSTGRWSHREELTGHSGDVVEAAVDPAGRRLITLGLDHTIISWDMGADGGFGRSYPGLAGRWISNRPQPVPGGLIVAPTRPGVSTSEVRHAGPGPETLHVAAVFLDPATGRVEEQVPLGDTIDGVAFGSSVAVSPDRSMVAVTWGLGTTVLDTRTRQVIEEIVLPPNGDPGIGDGPFPATVVWSTGWTPDGSTLLLGAEGNVARGTGGYLVPVDTTTWEIGPRIEIGGAAQRIEPSPDGTLLAVASTAQPEIVILDAATLEVQRLVRLATDDLLGDLSFSPDGRLLAGGGAFGLVHVLDTATWEYESGPATVHDAPVLQLEWLPDGRTVVTTGTDGTVSLFDVERGVVRARPLRGSGEPNEGYAHLVPGATDELVVLSGERSGWRYPLELTVWLEEACTIAGRDLTRAEWDRYLPGRGYERTCAGLS